MPTASAMHVIPSGAPLGAEIVGVDLSEQIDDQTFHAIDAAYNDVWQLLMDGLCLAKSPG